MGKAKKERRRQQREEEERRKAELLRAQKKRQSILIAIPLMTAALAAGAYFGLDDGRLVGVAILLGMVAFFLVGLSALGSSVPPRDRNRAGSIDFGN